jgi:hypothetical protein
MFLIKQQIRDVDFFPIVGIIAGTGYARHIGLPKDIHTGGIP